MDSNNCIQTFAPPVTSTLTASGTGFIGNTLQLWPEPQTVNYVNPYWTVTLPPQECAGDIHVFPCPHCDKCKCGAASVKRQKKS